MSARKFKPNDTVDFVVVGSGAAGGVMARELSQAGFDVVVLEQGPRFTAADFRHDELGHWFDGDLRTSSHEPADVPQIGDGKAERVADFPAAWYAPKWAAAACTSPPTSGACTRSTSRAQPLGAIPGTDFADWPITYDDLEPYYTKVEWEIGVSGLAGASPFDPPRASRTRCRRCR